MLVAAFGGLLQYDVSRWAEQQGVSSKVTISRAKGGLGEAGLITTTRVPRDVGRPRQRLQLAPDLSEAPIDEVVTTVAERLA